MKVFLFLAIWFIVACITASIFGKIAHEMGKDYPAVEDKDDES